MVTVSGNVDVKFSSPEETLVISVLIPASPEGYLIATGETNSNVDTVSTTYWKGPACGFSQYVAFSGLYGGSPDYSQFYVKLTTGTYTGGGGDSSSSSSLSAGEAAGVAIAVIIIVGLAGAAVYWCFCRGSRAAMSKSEKSVDAI